jgi:hypothetical protein
MKRSPVSPRSLALAILTFVAAAAARADQSATAHSRFGHGHAMDQCLLALDLPGAQLATIETSLAPGKAAMKEDGKALKAAHDQMEADLAAGADKAVLGSDVLAMDAARTKKKEDGKALHDQVLAQLSTEQQDTFNGCMATHTPHGGPGHAPAAPPSQ